MDHQWSVFRLFSLSAYRLVWLLTTMMLLSSTSQAEPVPSQANLQAQPESQFPEQITQSVSIQTEAEHLFRQGEQQLLSNQLIAAQQSFQQALDLQRAIANPAVEASVLNKLAETYLSLSQYDQAQTVVQQALVLWRKIKNQTGEAEALIHQGAVYHSQDQHAQALTTLQQALAIQQQIGDGVGQAKTFLEMGVVAVRQGNAKEGLEQFQRGLDVLQAIESSPDTSPQARLQQGRLLGWKGFAQLNLQQPDLALQTLQQALAIHREIGDRQMEAATLFFTGIWHMNQNQFENALQVYQQVLPIYELSGNRSSVAHLQNSIGMAHYRLQQYPQAIAAFQQALAIYQESGDRKNTAQVWSYLGQIYRDQEQYEPAIAAFQKALVLFKELQDLQAERYTSILIGQTHRNQAFALWQANKLTDAISACLLALEHLQQARNLAQQAQDQEAEKSVLLSIGITHGLVGQLYNEQGDDFEKEKAYSDALVTYQQALEHLEPAKSIARTFNNESLASNTAATLWNTHFSRATTFENLHQHSEGLSAMQQALAVLQENHKLPDTVDRLQTELATLIKIARFYRNLEQPLQAIETYQQGLKVNQAMGDDPAWKVRMLGTLADTYESISQYAKAVETVQQALVIVRQQLKNPAKEASLITTLGNIYTSQGQYPVAIQHYEEGLTLAKQQGIRSLEVTLLNNLGNVYEGQGQYRKALDYREQTLAAIEEILPRLKAQDETTIEQLCLRIDPSVERAVLRLEDCINLALTIQASAFNSLGVSYNNLGRYKDALKQHQQGLAIIRSLRNRELEATSLGNIGVVYLGIGDYAKARTHFQQALEIQIAIGDRAGQSITLSNIGSTYQEQGQYAQALDYRQQAMTIAQQIGARNQEATLFNSIGSLYEIQGNFEQASDFYQQALAIAESFEIKAIAQLNNIGKLYEQRGDLPKALALYQQALSTAQATGDRQNEAVLLGNLSDVYWSQGRYAQSLQQQQQLRVIHQETGNRPSEVIALYRLGWSYRILGQQEQALELLQQALTLSRQLGTRSHEAMILNQIGVVYREQQRYPEALKHHQQALAMQQEMGELQATSSTLMSIGTVQVQQGQFAQAIVSFQKALQILQSLKMRPNQAIALRGLALAHAGQGKLSQAIELLQQALVIHQAVQDQSEEGITLSELGHVLLKNNQPQAAETALFNAAEILDSLRAGLSDRDNISLFDTQAKTYRLLQQALIAQNKPEAALEAAERGRARAFVELLAQQLTPSPSLETEGETSANQIQPPNLSQIRQIAQQQNATLVEYSILPKEDGIAQGDVLLIWVIKPTGEIDFRQVNLQPAKQLISQTGASTTHASSPNSVATLKQSLIESLITHTRFSMSSRGSLAFIENEALVSQVAANLEPESSQNQQLQQLYQILIEPIADLLPSDPEQRVIVIPQGSLFLVPFAALQDRQGQYLIDKHTLITAPSIQSLELTHQQRQRQVNSKNSLWATNQQASDWLIVGNPVMPEVKIFPDQPAFQLADLPGAEAEAKAIAEFLQVPALLGAQATKVTVVQQMPQAKVIHLATHGLMDEARGLGSAIALTPSKTDNGLLTAEEILNLKLQAELVVLSACDTGRGRLTGDGVIGLSRSLFSAGVPSVVVSLWAVPDSPTAFLMTEFYRQLQQNPDKAQALRKAMLAAKQSYNNPIDWAAFVLIGEAQ